MMKQRLIDFKCAHCGSAAGQACLSVGHKPIVAFPHRARLKALEAAGVSDDSRSASRDVIQEYEANAIASVFGAPIERIPQRIIDRAKRERSIDVRKLWVKDAIALLGGHRRKPESEQGALL